ncbi:response regulator [Carboxylicivirga marina]|uniref:response regulator n=1 Tax=Carboxylicivirga marina TaxID=2800988 RepID=UPI002598F9A4|nr:response regulator [uncultured Carboxylicivirga sp.]
MKKVLIVDDCPDSRFTLKTILESYHVEIYEAPDGLDGWKNIINKKPDLVLLDLEMPHKDGFEVLDDIKEEWIDVPVVVISGVDADKAAELCQLNGALAFIQKPVNLSVFNETVNPILSD